MKKSRRLFYMISSYAVAILGIIMVNNISFMQRLFLCSFITFLFIIPLVTIIYEAKLNPRQKKIFSALQVFMSFLFFYVFIGVILNNVFSYFNENVSFSWQEALYVLPALVALVIFIKKIAEIKD